MTPAQALGKLRQHGELTLFRSRWCTPEHDAEGGWREVLSLDVGIRLVNGGRAVLVDGKILRPAPSPAGGG